MVYIYIFVVGIVSVVWLMLYFVVKCESWFLFLAKLCDSSYPSDGLVGKTKNASVNMFKGHPRGQGATFV